MKPASMPMPARPKPAHQPTVWPSQPQMMRGPERAEIDAVVVEREAGIAARIALRVELADDGGDVGLQEADAHDDEREREIEDAGEERIAVLDRQFVRALRQNRRQRRAGRQVLDRKAAIGGWRRIRSARRRPSSVTSRAFAAAFDVEDVVLRPDRSAPGWRAGLRSPSSSGRRRAAARRTPPPCACRDSGRRGSRRSAAAGRPATV